MQHPNICDIGCLGPGTLCWQASLLYENCASRHLGDHDGVWPLVGASCLGRYAQHHQHYQPSNACGALFLHGTQAALIPILVGRDAMCQLASGSTHTDSWQGRSIQLYTAALPHTAFATARGADRGGWGGVRSSAYMFALLLLAFRLFSDLPRRIQRISRKDLHSCRFVIVNLALRGFFLRLFIRVDSSQNFCTSTKPTNQPCSGEVTSQPVTEHSKCKRCYVLTIIAVDCVDVPKTASKVCARDTVESSLS